MTTVGTPPQATIASKCDKGTHLGTAEQAETSLSATDECSRTQTTTLGLESAIGGAAHSTCPSACSAPTMAAASLNVLIGGGTGFLGPLCYFAFF